MTVSFEAIRIIVLILLTGVVCARIAQRLNVPTLIPLLVAGMLIGPAGFSFLDLSQIGLSVTTLMFFAIPLLLFEEGMRTNIKSLKDVAVPVVLLATVGVLVTGLGVGLFAHIILGWPLLLALLLGAIVSATDPGVIIPLIRRLGRTHRTHTIVFAESAFNDASSAVLAAVIIQGILGNSLSPTRAVADFVRAFFGGLGVGGAIGYIASQSIRRFHLDANLSPISLAVFLLSYTASESLGLNGISGSVMAGLFMGNYARRARGRREKLAMFSLWENIGFLAQATVFLVLGALTSPTDFLHSWVAALAVTAFLIVVIRPSAVFLCTIRQGLSTQEKMFISWMGGARGAVPAALASSVVALNLPRKDEIFSIVITLVMLTIALLSISGTKVSLWLRPPRIRRTWMGPES